MNDSSRFVLAISLIWAALGSASVAGFEAPEFRPWEHLYDHDADRFAARRHIAMLGIGDLGYKTWNRALQSQRETTFTTDRWGYRNPSDLRTAPIVVIGDSYVAGSGLSDDETVSARLSDRIGVPVYNFASEALNAPAFFLRDERFIRSRPEVVIWAPVARGIAPRPLFFTGSESAPPSLAERVAERGHAFSDFVERLNRDNGLVREARFALQGFLGRWREDPRARRLPGGEVVLALDLAEQNLLLEPEQREVDHCIQMVALFADILQRAGVRFVFSPIPESGTIYPELFDAAERRALPRDSFLDRLLDGVRQRGVEVVDLTELYRRRPTPYLYLPDDSHWNARAVDLAAGAWAGALGRDPAPEGIAARLAR